MTEVRLRAPAASDRARFLDAVRRSGELHHPWVAAPDTDEAFERYLERSQQANASCRLVETDAGELVGVYNLSDIIGGVFRNAYLGYYAFVPQAGAGLMRAAMPLVFRHAFAELELHRLQAAVQPGNVRSRALLEATGWREEGFAPRYLFIDGAWRDHVLYAITAEETSYGA